jgi:F-type H+-transporting ATPase subunit b
MRVLLVLQEHGVPAPGGEAHVATPFDINTGVIFWTLIVFGLLLLLLWRFAWPAILKTVEERERRIQRQLEETERNRVESARLLEEHQRLIAGGRAEAQELIAKAKQVAEKEREALLARTRQEQEELLARARREIDDEKQKALLALRKEAVDLAMAAAAKLIEVKLDSEANRRLVEEYLASLERVS